jgi:aminomethyltransferase
VKKSPFFETLNFQSRIDFEQFLLDSAQDEHFISWNEYVLPLDYGDAESEYQAIRNNCAIFDVSPLRKYRIQGKDSGAFLDFLVTRPVSQAPVMRGIYVVFCNEDGSLKDDAILHKYSDEDYLLLPSDMDHSKHFEMLVSKLGLEEVTIQDCSDSLVGMAIQGPMSAQVLEQMGFAGIEQIKPMEVAEFPLSGGTIRIARMGFTADLGYECWMQPELGEAFEQCIRSARDLTGLTIPGYGLSALQACRLEGGFIVAGWDCATEADPNPGFERSPFELGLGWLVDLASEDFFGRDVLLEEHQSGSRFSLRSFQINDPRSPEDGAGLFVTEGGEKKAVGLITCSSWSWDLGTMIGNASIEQDYSEEKEVWTWLEGDSVKVELSRGPLRSFARSKQVPAPLAF